MAILNLPKDCLWFSLGELGSLSQGLLLSRYQLLAQEQGQGKFYRVVQLRDLEHLRLNSAEFEQARLVLPQTSEVLLKEGDVLITIKGASQRASVVGHEGVGAVAVQNIAVFRQRRRLGYGLLPLYLAGLLSSETFEPFLARLYRQSTGTRSISLKQLRQVQIPVPKLEYQQQLADVFVALEDFTLACNRAVAARRSLIEQTLSELFKGEPHE